MFTASGCNGIVTNPFLSNRFRLCEDFGDERTPISFDRTARRMKLVLPIVLALVCAGLVISLVVIKRGDNARHENDAGAIDDFSNRLTSAQTQIAAGNGTILTLSNNLDESLSAALTFSNHLTEAEAAIVLDTEQITNLNRRVAEVESENQTLGRRVMTLTNQMAGLTSQIASNEASLKQADKDYALLENRLRIDVAERIVMERKFNNPMELQTQMQKLKQNPTGVISADSIYAGLDVEVKSNTFHVIAPN
jgi:peptidoglycan hydrolase CwlO-like protein